MLSFEPGHPLETQCAIMMFFGYWHGMKTQLLMIVIDFDPISIPGWKAGSSCFHFAFVEL
jgi:hypothetical protein